MGKCPAAFTMRLDSVLPNNVDAERAVLGAMMMADVAAIILPILDKDDFYNDGNGCIYEAIAALFEADTKVDLLTVVQQLESHGTLAKAGSVPYLNEMIDSVPSAGNVEYHAEMVKTESMRRVAILASAKMYHECFDDTLEFDDVISDAEKAILDIRMDRVQKPASSLKSVFNSTLKRMSDIADNPDGLLGIATGFHKLDDCIQGIQRGELTVIAGRPGMGKSLAAHQVALHAARHCGEPACLFSLEMPEESLGMRIVSGISAVPFDFIRRAELTEGQWGKVIGAFNDLSEVPLYIDDTPGITVEEIQARCHQMVSTHGLSVVVVDYYQLVQKKGKSERLAELEAISMAMKNLARSLDVAVVLVAQLNRNVEGREKKRPLLSDIKSCGQLEQDADVVIFIYRDEYYTKDPNDHSAEFIVAKQRNGTLDTINLKFDGARARFLNL